MSGQQSNKGEGQSLINKNMCLYFLDEMSLYAARQVNLSRLKIKTRLFVDEGLPHILDFFFVIIYF